MRSTLLIVLILVPTIGMAQKACYSPSDCMGMEHCTSLDDGIVPGRCTTDARIIQKIKPKPVVQPAPKKPASSSSSKISSSSSVSSSSSSSSMTSSMSSSSSSSDAGVLSGLYDSIMGTMKSLMNSFSSMMNSMKCMFGGCK